MMIYLMRLIFINIGGVIYLAVFLMLAQYLFAIFPLPNPVLRFGYVSTVYSERQIEDGMTRSLTRARAGKNDEEFKSFLQSIGFVCGDLSASGRPNVIGCSYEQLIWYPILRIVRVRFDKAGPDKSVRVTVSYLGP